MGELPRANVDGTRDPAVGLPYRRADPLTEDIPRLGSGLAAAAAVALAAFAFIACLTYGPIPGVLADDTGGLVRAVDQGGFAWRDGIRGGQTVVAIVAADDPGGWQIETIDDAGVHRISSTAQVEAAVERTTIVALLAIAFAAVGFIRGAVASATAGLAVGTGAALAAITLSIHGDQTMSSFGTAAAALIVGCRLAYEVKGRWMASLVVAATVMAVGWSAFNRGPSQGRGPDGLVWFAIATWLMVLAIIWARRVDVPGRSGPRPTATGDALLAIVAGGLFLSGATFGWIPWPLATCGAVIVLLASPSGRRRMAGLVDSAWLDSIRKTASVSALDEERSRVAADLHDAPLQEIAGVIARLERVPAVDHERETLRSVSIHLRELVTGLEPPMLDQLGLVPALDYVAAQQQAQRGPRVTVAVRADTARPPHAVEVAAYRIAEEALRNAVNHAQAANVVISGEVSEGRVTVHVSDDGVGVGTARPRGGLASMPARARAVGGRSRCLPGRNGGTIIAFEWQSS
jgi:signal transduction histidine kinase